MVYISGAASITHQPTFLNLGFSKGLKPLEVDSALIIPDFKAYIEPQLIRRMGKLLRMSVACAKAVLAENRGNTPEAIVVGTGLGCLQDTEKFLTNFLTLDGLIPPTSFIQSTHNTIAGQISLSLGCHAYNMTHTQNTLSFEMALLDGLMRVEEGNQFVLVGAADESIPFLEQIKQSFGMENCQLTTGASFFGLSAARINTTTVRLIDVSATIQKGTFESMVIPFLEQNGLSESDVTLWVTGEPHTELPNTGEKVAFLPLSGYYPTASAFGFHYAVDFLQAQAGIALVLNQWQPNHWGLTLLESGEA